MTLLSLPRAQMLHGVAQMAAAYVFPGQGSQAVGMGKFVLQGEANSMAFGVCARARLRELDSSRFNQDSFHL